MSAVELLNLLDELKKNFVIYYNDYKKTNNIKSSFENIKNDIEITNNLQKMREFLLLEIGKENK